MSKLMKKFGGSKNVTISVKMDVLEVMGPAVIDKDMFCVHWIMKGLRGRENSGDTENVRAVLLDGNYPVARFTDVFAGEVQVRPRKDGSGYDAMEFDMRVSQPALHKKDEKAIGKGIINIFEKVPVITPGQPTPAEQTIPLVKDGSCVVHVKLTFLIKGEGTEEHAEPAPVEAEQPQSPSEPDPNHLVVKTPPASPAKDAGSESGSASVSEAKEEVGSKRTHRHRRSSNTASMAAEALKKKEEEMKQMHADFEAERNKLNDQITAQSSEIEELKKANEHLELRVKELEQAKEQTDVVPINPEEEKTQQELARLQAQTEELQEQRASLLEDKEEAEKKIAELTEALEAARKEAENKPENASGEGKEKELALLKEQLAALKAELGKKDTAPAPAAPANNMMTQAIIGAVGAIVGIIVGLIL